MVPLFDCREDILGMEKQMLATLQYDLTVPTCYLFTARFRKAAGVHEDLKVCGPHSRSCTSLLTTISKDYAQPLLALQVTPLHSWRRCSSILLHLVFLCAGQPNVRVPVRAVLSRPELSTPPTQPAVGSSAVRGADCAGPC